MSQILWLAPGSTGFPPLEQALSEPNGLIAAGGDLTPVRLLNAYRSGIFPWYESGQPILWWSPDPRCVIFPSDIHISRSLRRRLRSGAYEVRRDTCFAQVIERCSASRNGTPADPDSTAGTWITSEMQQAYGQLHELGFAHSFETFKDGQLVGGLYGVSIGRMFYGESMFHEADDASKVAFAYLCRSMQQLGCPVIDSQVENDHMRSLGAHSIPRKAFIRYVHQYAGDAVESMPWHVLPTRLGPW